jgi:hypothetical protein
MSTTAVATQPDQRTEIDTDVVARWVNRDGSRRVVVRRHLVANIQAVYFYEGPGTAGSLGKVTAAQAVAEVERRINEGFFSAHVGRHRA